MPVALQVIPVSDDSLGVRERRRERLWTCWPVDTQRTSEYLAQRMQGLDVSRGSRTELGGLVGVYYLLFWCFLDVWSRMRSVRSSERGKAHDWQVFV